MPDARMPADVPMRFSAMKLAKLTVDTKRTMKMMVRGEMPIPMSSGTTGYSMNATARNRNASEIS